MTMTEKILVRASEKPQLSPGENVCVNVDILMTHDVCGPGSIGIFKREFGENAKGKKVKVPIFLVPATRKVWMDVYSLPVPGSGGKTCSQIFVEAGCDTPASPSCGACLGGPKDTNARMDEAQMADHCRSVFPRQIGIFLVVWDTKKARSIWLLSPYTAAASAMTGFGTDPREFLH